MEWNFLCFSPSKMMAEETHLLVGKHRGHTTNNRAKEQRARILASYSNGSNQKGLGL